MKYFLIFCVAVFLFCVAYRHFFPVMTPHAQQRQRMERYFEKLEAYARESSEADDAKLIQDMIDSLSTPSPNSK